MNAEHRATDLHHDLRLLEKLSSDSLRAMADTQKELSQVGTDNNQLLSKGKYHCTADLLLDLLGLSCFACVELDREL